MREKQIERKLVNAVKAAGGIAPKFVSPGYDGMPDRLLLLQGGRMAFVEVKALGEKPRPLQTARHMDTFRADVKAGLATATPIEPTTPKKYYRVQVGAYSVKANADAMLAKIKAAGFTDAFIKYSE